MTMASRMCADAALASALASLVGVVVFSGVCRAATNKEVAQIIAGWLLSAIFIAGVTGLIRND